MKTMTDCIGKDGYPLVEGATAAEAARRLCRTVYLSDLSN